MNIKYKLSSIAASFLLAACTSENTLEPPTPPDEGTASANNTREVLLSLKNKLKVSPVGTKDRRCDRCMWRPRPGVWRL